MACLANEIPMINEGCASVPIQKTVVYQTYRPTWRDRIKIIFGRPVEVKMTISHLDKRSDFLTGVKCWVGTSENMKLNRVLIEYVQENHGMFFCASVAFVVWLILGLIVSVWSVWAFPDIWPMFGLMFFGLSLVGRWWLGVELGIIRIEMMEGEVDDLLEKTLNNRK